LHASW
jgi:hypothetical protein